MNKGLYANNSEYQLIVRTAWNERYAFAADEAEARSAPNSDRVNHDQPDLGLYINSTELPVEMPQPGQINIAVTVANLGEATSGATRLAMTSGENEGKFLSTAQVPPLKPGTDETIVMPLDYDGKMKRLSFRLHDNTDFDPSNDSLDLVLWGPKPTGYVGPEPGLPKVPLELTVKIANESQSPEQYQIVDAFSERRIAKVVKGEQFGPLRSGTYQVAMKPYPFEGQEVLFKQDIKHVAGTQQQVELKSGIRIEPPDLAALWQWSAMDPLNPGRIIQWQSGLHPLMVLPPGEYQLAIQPFQFDSQRLMWTKRIQVPHNQQVALKLDSAVHIDMPQGVQPLWQWRAVRFGRPNDVVQWQRGNQQTMLLPPGDYQLAVHPFQFESQRLVYPQKIQVRTGQQTIAALNNILKIEMPQGVQPLWRWQAVRFGKADEIIQWQTGTLPLMLLPPGDYQLAIHPFQFESQRLVYPEKIQVQTSGQVTFKLDSSVRIEMPPDATQLWKWELVKSGRLGEVVQWHYGSHKSMLAPPGDYQVVITPTQFESERLLWPQKVQVTAGRQATVQFDSGIRLVGKAGGQSNFEFQLVDGSGRIVQRGRHQSGIELIPPGVYSFQIRPNQFGPWKTMPDSVIVTKGQFADVRIPELP